MKYLAATLLLLIVFPADVRCDDALIGPSEVSIGNYGMAKLGAGTVNGQAAVFTGLGAGWTFNRSATVGFAVYGLAADIDAPAEAKRVYGRGNLEIDISYAGLEWGYVHNLGSSAHLSVTALIGAGRVALRDESASNERDDFDRSDEIFIAEPSLNAELNITSWLRGIAGVSYRAAFDLSIAGLDDSDMSGPAGMLAVRFGKF